MFLKGPPVLVPGEGTSALDAVSERQVRQALGAARREWTVLLVAQRLSTLRAADRVAVLEGGRAVEAGTYQELVRRGGALAALARNVKDA